MSFYDPLENWMAWQCSCDACEGTLAPPEGTPDEYEEWLAQQTPNREIDIIEGAHIE